MDGIALKCLLFSEQRHRWVNLNPGSVDCIWDQVVVNAYTPHLFNLKSPRRGSSRIERLHHDNTMHQEFLIHNFPLQPELGKLRSYDNSRAQV